MGATTFFAFQPGINEGTANALRARDEAVRRACYDHGNEGYTGTIAEKYELVFITREPMTLHDARDLASELIHRGDPRIDDKWGPMGAIPINDADAGTGWFFFGWASC